MIGAWKTQTNIEKYQIWRCLAPKLARNLPNIPEYHAVHFAQTSFQYAAKTYAFQQE